MATRPAIGFRAARASRCPATSAARRSGVTGAGEALSVENDMGSAFHPERFVPGNSTTSPRAGSCSPISWTIRLATVSAAASSTASALWT